ncbi:MAG: selenium-dependent molybdenum cofactor biosynthesis protein YqeB [Brevefilum sp.]
MKPFVLMWGGGDLASGAAIRLHRVGIRILIVEAAQPLAVRRSVSFAQAVYDGEVAIEGVRGSLITQPEEVQTCWSAGKMPVMVDPDLAMSLSLKPLVMVDARMRKVHQPLSLDIAQLVIGMGPGFVAGENCHAAVETNRGHFLGRVYWAGSTEADTGVPGKVGKYAQERVLHAPVAGVVQTYVEIGTHVKAGDLVLAVGGQGMYAPFEGIVRGLIYPGLLVEVGTKVGDIDPRPDDFRCWTVSEKSLAIGGGVLEAILTRPEVRAKLWDG